VSNPAGSGWREMVKRFFTPSPPRKPREPQVVGYCIHCCCEIIEDIERRYVPNEFGGMEFYEVVGCYCKNCGVQYNIKAFKKEKKNEHNSGCTGPR